MNDPSESSAPEQRQHRALDAGCGAGQAYVTFPPDTYVVGIDMSDAALARNETVDEKLIGDIQTYPFSEASFDQIVCWDVLEHLPRPIDALRNLARALKPGGSMTIGVPNLATPKVVLTKYTPFAFHVWVYRRLFHFSHAGEEGYGPYPTYLRWSLRRSALTKEAGRLGLEVVSVRVYEAESLKIFWKRYPITRRILTILWPIGDAFETECEFQFSKPVGMTDPLRHAHEA